MDLGSTTTVQFTRNFSIPQKQEVYLLHIDVQASENNVKEVMLSAEINNIVTMVNFEDSSTKYSSSHSFYGGTQLSFEINPNTTLSVISNTLILTINVVFSSLSGEEGTFHVKSAAFETIAPPTIGSDSAETSLPMEVSRGSWYVAPLSTLNERKLESKLFTDISDDVYLRLDIDVTPSDYPLTSTDFKVSNGITTFESVSSGSNPMKGTVYANVTRGDQLVLEFNFRPSSDLANNVIDLEVKVVATPVTIIPDNGPSGTGGETTDIDANFLNLALPDLELLRFSMILIPLFFYFNRSKKQNKSNNYDYSKKGDSIGTNEK
jgi:hypothetical protein